MGDLDYTDYQNLAEGLMDSAHSGTVAQYASIINDPEMLGQHLMSDAGAFLLHKKVGEGVKGLANALDFSEEDVQGVLGEIGDGASSAVGAIGKLVKNIKGAINDRYGDYAKKLRGHTAPENTSITESQNLSDDAIESVARLPGGRTHGLLPFEQERPDDEFSNPVNPDAPRAAGAPNPDEEDASADAGDQPTTTVTEEESDLDRISQEEAESLFEPPPPPTDGQDMQNAPNPDNDTSAANDANARNAADQDMKRIAGGEEEEDLAAGETALDLDPLTAIVGVGALIGSFFIHPHQEKEVAPAQEASNFSVQIGA